MTNKDTIKLIILLLFWFIGAFVADCIGEAVGFIVLTLNTLLCVFYVLYDDQKEKTEKQKKLKHENFREFMKNR